MIKYSYPMLNESWDIHWIRPRLYYEIGLFPDYISIANQQVELGFSIELSPQNKIILDTAMANTNIGLEPTGIKHKFTATIRPEKLTTAIQSAIGKKIIYYCVDGKVDICFFDDLTQSDITNLKNALKNLWQ